MSEHSDQVALFRWAALQANRYPQLRLMFAVPNGGIRSKATAAKLKAEGVKAGIPDVCLPVPIDGFGACYIEMKRAKEKGKPAGRESQAQKDMRKALSDAGNYAVVCFGWEDAKDALLWYMNADQV